MFGRGSDCGSLFGTVFALDVAHCHIIEVKHSNKKANKQGSYRVLGDILSISGHCQKLSLVMSGHI